MTVLLPLLHFSLSMDVSSPDLFGSIHEDFSLTSVSKMPNTESKVCHVKGCGCGNQPESWKMDSVDFFALLWDYILLCKYLCMRITLKKIFPWS